MKISPKKNFKLLLSFTMVLGILILTPKSNAEDLRNTKQTAEVVLNELLISQSKFIIVVPSNGCTEKNSFTVNIKKEKIISTKMPNYALKVIRIQPDECKEPIENGKAFIFDLEKDLKLNGNFQYTVTNKVISSSIPKPIDESLFAIIEKYFTIDFLSMKEIRPEPFNKYTMDHDYFSCYIPSSWKLERDKKEDNQSGIYEIKLTKKDTNNSENILLPDPLIYLGYYANGNKENKTFESYVENYEKLQEKNKNSNNSRYEKPKTYKLKGYETLEYTYEVYQEIPRGPLFKTKYWLKAKFIFIRAEDGFYILAYKSPKEQYNIYLPIFESVIDLFQPLKTGDQR